jgi:hypothetical protein
MKTHTAEIQATTRTMVAAREADPSFEMCVERKP